VELVVRERRLEEVAVGEQEMEQVELMIWVEEVEQIKVELLVRGVLE